MVEFRSRLDSRKSQALNKRSFLKLLWLLLLLSAVFIVIGVCGVVFQEDDADFVGGVTFIVIGVLFTPIVYILSRIFQKSVDKSTTFISENTEEIYTFDEQYVTATQIQGDVFTATLKAKYSYIYKASEDKDYYYLFISKMQSHVIEKASITQGTLEEMQTLLKTNLGSKFKSK